MKYYTKFDTCWQVSRLKDWRANFALMLSFSSNKFDREFKVKTVDFTVVQKYVGEIIKESNYIPSSVILNKVL